MTRILLAASINATARGPSRRTHPSHIGIFASSTRAVTSAWAEGIVPPSKLFRPSLPTTQLGTTVAVLSLKGMIKAVKLGIGLTLATTFALSASALATPAPLNEARPLDWSVVTDSFGTAVDYPAAIFTSPAPPPPRGVGHSFRSADGSALFMMYVERNDGHDTPQSYVRRNLTRPQSLLQYQRITGRFFAVSSTEADVMFYSRCNFPDGAGGLIHCIFISYPKSEKRAWDDVVTRMSLTLRVRR